MDRRAAPRLHREHSVTASMLPSEKGGPTWEKKPVQILSKDVSSTGIRCRVPHFTPTGARVRIELQLTGPRQLLASVGTVRWTRELPNLDMYELGIEFDDCSRDFVETLSSYVSGHLESASEG